MSLLDIAKMILYILINVLLLLFTLFFAIIFLLFCVIMAFYSEYFINKNISQYYFDNIIVFHNIILTFFKDNNFTEQCSVTD